ncbi:MULTISPECIES: HEAT repeat domain-containing protein [Mycolicibacterium]|uniref:HEAT repeat domain-containing protein n=1 Tax=Mycolicibacterium TaxID=1866885 RepID=UPI001E4F8107|nr:HEAT repeat domain-containing protein [Mycolicibacterium mageritense]GJJ21288.1 hypothetical protein MTY414_49610 [Mycolicibacterium mageritense]
MNDDVVARLRRGIAEIETTGPVDRAAAAAARKARREMPKAQPIPTTYPGMPEGDDWMDRVPAKYRHGEGGFDRRLMEDLAAAGFRCYRADLLYTRDTKNAIPVALDWLEHLEERIPGPETRHRELIRGWLIERLDHAAIRGNARAIDVVTAQIRRREPPLPSPFSDAAGQVLARAATPRHFDRIVELFDELEDGNHAKYFLIAYFGKVKTDESRDIVLPHLDRCANIVIPTLIKMNATGVRHLIEPHLKSSWPPTRRYARRAMERLT